MALLPLRTGIADELRKAEGKKKKQRDGMVTVPGSQETILGQAQTGLYVNSCFFSFLESLSRALDGPQSQ